MKHHVIITCLTAEYHKQLPALLLNKGYSVSPGYDNNQCTRTKGIVSFIVYVLGYNGKKIKNNENVNFDISSCFKEIKGYYYSVFSRDYNNNINPPDLKFGNIDGETDITRVIQMKALW